MQTGVRIDPDALYDDSSIVLALGIASATLIRARRDGVLRYRRVGRRAVYLGRWLLDWLSAPDALPIPVEARRA